MPLLNPHDLPPLAPVLHGQPWLKRPHTETAHGTESPTAPAETSASIRRWYAQISCVLSTFLRRSREAFQPPTRKDGLQLYRWSKFGSSHVNGSSRFDHSILML
jgi:hypothetical protein